MTGLVVFTDLDGTLLDHRTYDFRPALPAIEALRARRVPLIFCSSKTASEIEALRLKTGNEDPFIVENGGAIHIPFGALTAVPDDAEIRRDRHVVRMGRECEELERFLSGFCRRKGLSPSLLTKKSPGEVAVETGLSEEEARRSLDREFDLPFTLPTGSVLPQLEREARANGFRLIAGGRYLHLSGDTGKGDAARLLKDLYHRQWGEPVRAVGLGDSLNDLDLLQAVEIPVVIPNPGSGAPLADALPAATVAPEPGPAGWNAAILSILKP